MVTRASLTAIFVLSAVAILPALVSGHGSMVIPYNWFDHPQWIQVGIGYFYDSVGVGMKSGHACTAGRDIPSSKVCRKPEYCQGTHTTSNGESCFWFNNYTFVEKPTLFDPKLRTYPHTTEEKEILHHPWRAPGHAPIVTPCGAAGGNPNGCEGGPQCANDQGGFQFGPKAEDFEFDHEIHVTNWTRGEHVEVVWGIRANHGGGYSYRLCKLPKEGRKALTEECFQQIPLRFVGDKQWIQYGEDRSTRYEFQAVRTNVGTFPSGSQWTKNPIPACNGNHGGRLQPENPCLRGTQFPAPGPNLEGYGLHTHFKFSIIDLVEIPKDLPTGEYVISFRWDCEQTPQVWNTCASVRIS